MVCRPTFYLENVSSSDWVIIKWQNDFLYGDEIVYFVCARSILWILHLQLMLIWACNSIIQDVPLVQLYIQKYQVGIHTSIPPHPEQQETSSSAIEHDFASFFVESPGWKLRSMQKLTVNPPIMSCAVAVLASSCSCCSCRCSGCRCRRLFLWYVVDCWRRERTCNPVPANLLSFQIPSCQNGELPHMIMYIVVWKDKCQKGDCICQYTCGRIRSEPPPLFAKRGGGTTCVLPFSGFLQDFNGSLRILNRAPCPPTKVGG